MVTVVLYHPPTPSWDPMALRTFLLCRTSRPTIIRVRRTLSEIEIERYGTAKLKVTEFQILVPGREDRRMNVMVPIAILGTLTQGIATGSQISRMRTDRGNVHEAGEGNYPELHGVDHVATIELGEEPVLDTWESGDGIKRGTNQETIGQPVVQEEHKIGDDGDRFWANEVLVSERARG